MKPDRITQAASYIDHLFEIALANASFDNEIAALKFIRGITSNELMKLHREVETEWLKQQEEKA